MSPLICCVTLALLSWGLSVLCCKMAELGQVTAERPCKRAHRGLHSLGLHGMARDSQDKNRTMRKTGAASVRERCVASEMWRLPGCDLDRRPPLPLPAPRLVSLRSCTKAECSSPRFLRLLRATPPGRGGWWAEGIRVTAAPAAPGGLLTASDPLVEASRVTSGLSPTAAPSDFKISPPPSRTHPLCVFVLSFNSVTRKSRGSCKPHLDVLSKGPWGSLVAPVPPHTLTASSGGYGDLGGPEHMGLPHPRSLSDHAGSCSGCSFPASVQVASPCSLTPRDVSCVTSSHSCQAVTPTCHSRAASPRGPSVSASFCPRDGHALAGLRHVAEMRGIVFVNHPQTLGRASSLCTSRGPGTRGCLPCRRGRWAAVPCFIPDSGLIGVCESS